MINNKLKSIFILKYSYLIYCNHFISNRHFFISFSIFSYSYRLWICIHLISTTIYFFVITSANSLNNHLYVDEISVISFRLFLFDSLSGSFHAVNLKLNYSQMTAFNTNYESLFNNRCITSVDWNETVTDLQADILNCQGSRFTLDIVIARINNKKTTLDKFLYVYQNIYIYMILIL